MFPDYRPDEWDVTSDDDTFSPPDAPEPEPPIDYASPPF
jgi:hypothetical protein